MLKLPRFIIRISVAGHKQTVLSGLKQAGTTIRLLGSISGSGLLRVEDVFVYQLCGRGLKGQGLLQALS